MEIHLLAIQARILLFTYLGWCIIGFVVGTDPTTIVLRGAIAAVIAMLAGGWLLRRVAGVIEERAAQEMAERQLAAQKAEETAAKQAADAKARQQPGRPAARPAATGR